MDERYIVHGPPPQSIVSKVSLGVQAFKALQKHEISNVFIDAFTKRTITNKELFETTIKLARSMQNFGLKQNDVIGIFSENSVMFFHPVLASLYLGVVVTMFNPQYTVGEFKHVSNISKPKIIFCSKLHQNTLAETIKETKLNSRIIVLDTEEIEDETYDSLSGFISKNLDESFEIYKFKPINVDTNKQVAFIVYSSGTTGLPKGVLLTHSNFNTVFALPKKVQPIVNEHIIGLLPFYHNYGFIIIFSKILTNQTTVVFKKFHPEAYLNAIQEYKIKYLHIIPVIAHFLATSKLVDKYDLSCVNKILSGGAPLSPEVQNLLSKRQVRQTFVDRQAYGLTETTISIICPQDSRTKFGSVGKVRSYVSVKIVDRSTGRTLGPMQKGELCCRGPQIMKGYMNDVVSTNNAFDKHGWFRTGDVAYYDHDGYFYIVDRIKELIKYKGFQVPPAELEAVLLKHPKIADAAVIGIPEEIVGEIPLAFVVKIGDVSEIEIQDFVAKELSPEKHLRGGVRFVENIPRNLSGKILKRVLRNSLNQNKSKL
ncbi:hypothetical protein FQR65_LT21021 [Abscondita terminalis]|nr:hypothetical protein FQR65_LT21021 [Abscondita terminalis]